jgi:hypothetical protein
MDDRLQAINRFVAGWTGHFYPADGERPFSDLDEWLRRRLRHVRWKEGKRPKTRRRNLPALGVAEQQAREWAGSRKRCWRIAGSAPLQRALPNAHWVGQGLVCFPDNYRGLWACRANRRMRTRTSGGVGGARVSPAPTRSGRQGLNPRPPGLRSEGSGGFELLAPVYWGSDEQSRPQ